MRIAIDDILKEQKRTLYWLAKESGCNYYALAKLARNETSLVSFETIEKVCHALNCLPNDILKINE